MSESAPGFVSTGIDGLDDVLFGGFLRGGFYLLQGEPGSGKTTVALQFALSRMKASEKALYITLTETKDDLVNAARSHGWDLDGLHVLDLAQSTLQKAAESSSSVFHPADTELSETMAALIEEVERVDPTYVVFDGLSELRLLSSEPLRYRRQLLSLKAYFAKRSATVLLLDDRSSRFADFSPESLVGANIVLESLLPLYGRSRRRIFVTKVRGSQFREGYHDYEIVQGGVLVHPRLVAGDHRQDIVPSLWASGIPNLDAMLEGGLTAGSTTLFLGPAGVGKSTLSIQFVVNALKAGKKAAIFMFDEVRHILVERAEKLCIGKAGGFDSYVRDGLLRLQQVDPAELSPGAFTNAVRSAVDDGAEIIVIDSLNGYMNAMPEERSLTAHLHELFAFLNQKGVLTIIVAAQHGMLAAGGGLSDVDVSYLADGVLLFRYYEQLGAIRQAISVFKKRTGSHERSIRELTVSRTGVHVGQPLHELRGIMTGVPQYQSSATSEGEPKTLVKSSP